MYLNFGIQKQKNSPRRPADYSVRERYDDSLSLNDHLFEVPIPETVQESFTSGMELGDTRGEHGYIVVEELFSELHDFFEDTEESTWIDTFESRYDSIEFDESFSELGTEMPDGKDESVDSTFSFMEFIEENDNLPQTLKDSLSFVFELSDGYQYTINTPEADDGFSEFVGVSDELQQSNYMPEVIEHIFGDNFVISDEDEQDSSTMPVYDNPEDLFVLGDQHSTYTKLPDGTKESDEGFVTLADAVQEGLFMPEPVLGSFSNQFNLLSGVEENDFMPPVEDENISDAISPSDNLGEMVHDAMFTEADDSLKMEDITVEKTLMPPKMTDISEETVQISENIADKLNEMFYDTFSEYMAFTDGLQEDNWMPAVISEDHSESFSPVDSRGTDTSMPETIYRNLSEFLLILGAYNGSTSMPELKDADIAELLSLSDKQTESTWMPDDRFDEYGTSMMIDVGFGEMLFDITLNSFDDFYPILEDLAEDTAMPARLEDLFAHTFGINDSHNEEWHEVQYAQFDESIIFGDSYSESDSMPEVKDDVLDSMFEALDNHSFSTKMPESKEDSFHQAVEFMMEDIEDTYMPETKTDDYSEDISAGDNSSEDDWMPEHREDSYGNNVHITASVDSERTEMPEDMFDSLSELISTNDNLGEMVHDVQFTESDDWFYTVDNQTESTDMPGDKDDSYSVSISFDDSHSYSTKMPEVLTDTLEHILSTNDSLGEMVHDVQFTEGDDVLNVMYAFSEDHWLPDSKADGYGEGILFEDILQKESTSMPEDLNDSQGDTVTPVDNLGEMVFEITFAEFPEELILEDLISETDFMPESKGDSYEDLFPFGDSFGGEQTSMPADKYDSFSFSLLPDDSFGEMIFDITFQEATEEQVLSDYFSEDTSMPVKISYNWRDDFDLVDSLDFENDYMPEWITDSYTDGVSFSDALGEMVHDVLFSEGDDFFSLSDDASESTDMPDSKSNQYSEQQPFGDSFGNEQTSMPDKETDSYGDEVSFSDGSIESTDMPDDVSDRYGDNISFNDGDSESTQMPSPKSESHSDSMQTDDAVGSESTDMPDGEAESNEDDLVLVDEVSESAGQTEDEALIHEWDEQGLVLSSGEVDEWVDNVSGVSMVPTRENSKPNWDSTEKRVWAESNNDKVQVDPSATPRMGFLADNFQISFITHLGDISEDFRVIINLSPDGGAPGSEGGVYTNTNTIRNDSPTLVAELSGIDIQNHVEHNNKLSVVTIRHSGGTAEVIITTVDGETFSENISVAGATQETTRIAFNCELTSSGVTAYSGSPNNNVYAIRIWENDENRDVRIDGMLYDYLGIGDGGSGMPSDEFESFADELLFADSQSEIVGSEPSTSTLIHEWDSNGVVVTNGDEVHEWNDNVGSGQFATPSSNPVYWDSTNEWVYSQDNVGRLVTNVLGITADDFQISIVVDFSLFANWATILASSPEGGGTTPIYFSYGDGSFYISYNDTNVGQFGITDTLVIMTLAVKDGETLVRIDDASGMQGSTTDSGLSQAPDIDHLGFNGTFDSSGNLQAYRGDADSNLKAVRIWSSRGDDTEIQNRIDEMKSVYFADEPSGDSDLVHEWDSNGVSVDGSNNVTEWTDNIGGASMTPSGSPSYNSSTGEIIFGGSSENLYTDDLALDLNDAMICIVVDSSTIDYNSHFWTMCAGSGDRNTDGGAGMYRYSEDQLLYWVGGSDSDGRSRIPVNGNDAVICLRHKDGDIEGIFNDGINSQSLVSGSISLQSLITDKFALNTQLQDGSPNDRGGSNLTVKAVRIWSNAGDDNTERDERINQMVSDYL